MKKISKLILSVFMCASMVACSSGNGGETGKYTAGTYTGEADGFGGKVTVTITTDAKSITDVKCEGPDETETIGGAALEELAEQIKTAQSAEIDGVSGATFTTDGIKAAAAKAIENAEKGETGSTDSEENVPVTYTAGTYTGSAKGYNGPITVSVTFGDDKIESIEVTDSTETAHVGTSAFDILIADMIEANGSGVDSVSGATFSSRGLKDAVAAAAVEAKASDIDGFKKNTVKHEAGDTVEGTWDVVIVGAGGAGMMAGSQAAQDGNTVLIMEENAEIGGNTLVSGGAYQTAYQAVVWDAENPDATEAEYEGKTYTKVKNDAGRLHILNTISNWSEDEFDGTIDADHPFVAGDITLNAERGVHAEYLDVLKTLKGQIKEYMAWAQPQLDAGKKETDLTLFSTPELHIFQTYYGGLRPNKDGSVWIYSDIEKVKEFVNGGQDIYPWLTAQGADIDISRAFTLIGCLWQRENSVKGGTVDGEFLESKWGAYFAVPANTITKANDANEIMTRTTAYELIEEDGKVTGVKAKKFDGTEVVAHANKGVILATGGYGANIDLVQKTNDYWDDSFIADNIGTTNRSSLQGDGITMAEEVGADTDGMGWTQMMPLGWVDNGNLAGGAGENVIYINAATGKRYVDESAERDVLSKGAFENGMTKELADELGLKYVPGIYVEVSNTAITAGVGGFNNGANDIEGRMYFKTVAEVAEMLHLDEQTLRDTITEYDNYVMGTSTDLPVEKLAYTATVGDVEKDENGNYLPDTYKLENLRIRFLAPSTHHTMGGLVTDVNHHVLDKDGKTITGLYAAGEVTSGYHAGNRLGGNAITEIIVSGRDAAKAVTEDNK